MRRALALVLLLACGPVLPGGDDTGPGSTSAASSTTGALITTSMGSTSGMAESTTWSTTSVETGAAATTSIEETFSFLHPTDMPGSCDPWSQDCPAGEKCTWYAGDGGSAWNDTKCVPVMEGPSQEGEPCVAPTGGLSGIDDCDLGLMCWDVDAEHQGICVALCHGTPDAPFCDAPKTACGVYQGGFGLCLFGCDPLLQDCEPSDVCIGNPTGDGFLCMLDASGDEGQQHDPCMFYSTCDLGLFCADAKDAVECGQDAEGCCQPFCDLNDPDADAKCGGVGQVCTPYLHDGMAVPDFEHVGHCAVPE